MENTLKLITEQNFEDIQILEEDISVEKQTYGGPSKNYYIHGPCLVGNEKNRNGRRYPEHILDREANRYNKDFIQTNRALGELGHPEGPGINLPLASHKFTELRKEGHNWIGKAKILHDLPNGKIAAGLIAEGVKLGISSRGMGSVRNINGEDIVQDDYFLATPGDIVHDPSAPGAFVNGIYEKAEWTWNNGILVEHVIYDYKKELDKIPNSRLEEGRIKVFNDFMERISGKRNS